MASLDSRILCASIAALIATACNPRAQSAPPAQNEPPAAEQATTAQPTAEPAKPAADPAAKPAAQRPAACDTLCAHTLTLECGALEHCLEGCQEMAGQAQCPAEMTAMLGCMAAQPAANFECDRETEAPAIRDGHCDAEQAAVAKCFEPKAPAQ